MIFFNILLLLIMIAVAIAGMFYFPKIISFINRIFS